MSKLTVAQLATTVAAQGEALNQIIALLQQGTAVKAEPSIPAPAKAGSLDSLRSNAAYKLKDEDFQKALQATLEKAKARTKSTKSATNVVYVVGSGTAKANSRDYALYYAASRPVGKNATLLLTVDPDGSIKKHINLGAFKVA